MKTNAKHVIFSLVLIAVLICVAPPNLIRADSDVEKNMSQPSPESDVPGSVGEERMELDRAINETNSEETENMAPPGDPGTTAENEASQDSPEEREVIDCYDDYRGRTIIKYRNPDGSETIEDENGNPEEWNPPIGNFEDGTPFPPWVDGKSPSGPEASDNNQNGDGGSAQSFPTSPRYPRSRIRKGSKSS